MKTPEQMAREYAKQAERPELCGDLNAGEEKFSRKELQTAYIQGFRDCAERGRDELSDTIWGQAMGFCQAAHGAQIRKYTHEPYWYHCKSVAELVHFHTGGEMLPAVAAWLHDVLEDTEVEPGCIKDTFGVEVLRLVEEVTDISHPSDGNRAKRKAIDRMHLANASPMGQAIKLADLIDNARSIVKHDLNFARVYLAEKRDLLTVLTKGPATLIDLAQKTLLASQSAAREKVGE